MPIYEYQCRKCGYRFEVRQSFDDDRLTECQNDGCRGPVHQVFSPPAIIFKGSGFHVTDYGRGSDRPKSEQPKSATTEGPSEKSDTSTEAPKNESR